MIIKVQSVVLERSVIEEGTKGDTCISPAGESRILQVDRGWGDRSRVTGGEGEAR